MTGMMINEETQFRTRALQTRASNKSVEEHIDEMEWNPTFTNVDMKRELKDHLLTTMCLGGKWTET